MLLSNPATNVTIVDLRGNSALGLAAAFGPVNNTEALLGTGAFDVNEANSGDWTPLMRASSRGRLDVVRLLLAQEGIEVDKVRIELGLESESCLEHLSKKLESES